MLYHYMLRGWAADDMSLLSFPEIGHHFQYGRLGVDLFFIISGFVILMTALKKDHFSFVISRITRLYPAFWFSVTFTAIVIVLFGGERYEVGFLQYLANLTMLHKYLGFPSVDGVYWTLVVELKFYFLIFLLVFFKQIHNIKAFLGLWLLSAIVLKITGHVPVLSHMLIPEWATYFIAGCLFYLLRHEGVSTYKIVLIFISYALALVNCLDGTEPFQAKYGVEPSEEITVLVITSFYAFFFALSLGYTKILNRPFFVYLGVMTYPLYLIHENVGFIIFNLFHDSVNKYLLVSSVSILMLIIAFMISKYIEDRYSGTLRTALVRVADKIKSKH